MAPATTTQLVVTGEFNAGGIPYSVGDVVAPEAPASWPEGALEARLEHKFVKYVSAPVPVAETPVGDLVDALSGKTKAQLAEYAATQGLTLDPEKLTKPDMLLEITTHMATSKSE